jgi:hypothetical protein
MVHVDPTVFDTCGADFKNSKIQVEHIVLHSCYLKHKRILCVCARACVRARVCVCVRHKLFPLPLPLKQAQTF